MKAEPANVDKVERAKPFASQVEAGNVYLLRVEWTKDFTHKHHNLRQLKLKDMVDTAGGAFNILALRKKDNTDWIEHLQGQNRQFRERLYQRRPQTLKDNWLFY